MPYDVEVKDFEQEYQERGSYHKSATGFSQWFLDTNYKLLAEGITADHKVLDLACGDGAFSKYLPTENIVGIDNAPTAIKLAQEAGIKGEYKVMDMTQLTFEDNTFDAVTCSLTLFYFGQEMLGKVLQEIKRVLKPQGKFHFSYKNLEHLKIQAHIAKMDKTMQSLSFPELEATLKEHGFTIHKKVGTNLILDYSTVQEAKQQELHELSKQLAHHLPHEAYHVIFYTEIQK